MNGVLQSWSLESGVWTFFGEKNREGALWKPRMQSHTNAHLPTPHHRPRTAYFCQG